MNSRSKHAVYKSDPLFHQDRIPVYSIFDRYVENYQKIASDHVAAITPGLHNPFIENALWEALEVSTRDLVLKYAKHGDRVLDVGVGMGRVLAPLKEFNRYGIDISFDYLNRSRDVGIEVAFSKIEDMPYQDASFDVVLTTDVLEHVLDLNLCTKEILRVLKPGGILIVRVPYKEDLSAYLADNLPYEYIHLRTFDEASLRLHFCKIFGLEFLEANSVAPYLQGSPRLRVRLLDEADRTAIREITSDSASHWTILERAIDVSAEEFMYWIYDLRDKNRAAYERISEKLVMGMDINATFRKKPMVAVEKNSVSELNSSFWNELCGSHLAQHLGVNDSSIPSLKRFDDWYFDFYPYLFKYIPFNEIRGKKVLEIGLGYGTVAQKLAEAGADYTGLDIAEGPVSMVNHRLLQNNLPGKAVQGSILTPEFADGSFDCVIAIGCLHHTGDLQLAINQCYRLLKPGGKLIFMVYYAYSYRRFWMTPALTAKYMVKELKGYRGVVGEGNDSQRAAYDASSKGSGAPHTDWISKRSLKHYCKGFRTTTVTIENIDQEPPFRRTPRTKLIKTMWPAICGLDAYVTATK